VTPTPASQTPQWSNAHEQVASTLADWYAARLAHELGLIAAHPDITDRYGRVWRWTTGELYEHDETLAFPRALIDTVGLPSATLAGNPNYANLCATCRQEWPT
jgi:hypothetical protein